MMLWMCHFNNLSRLWFWLTPSQLNKKKEKKCKRVEDPSKKTLPASNSELKTAADTLPESSLRNRKKSDNIRGVEPRGNESKRPVKPDVQQSAADEARNTVTTIEKLRNSPGIFWLPADSQDSHRWSSALFGWESSGSWKTPGEFQVSSQLQ